MTCGGCAKKVTEHIQEVPYVKKVSVTFEGGVAAIEMEKEVSLKSLKEALPSVYKISEGREGSIDIEKTSTKTKLQQLRPLFWVFGGLLIAVIALNFQTWNTKAAMLDFMGLFFIVFSFFKFLDFQGFPKSFQRYDPLAKKVKGYAWIYPFLEVILGVCFLLRFQLTAALIVTLIVLGITTIGVTNMLLHKRKVNCACLGTALKLPMTEATFIENTIMIGMAIWMLLA